MGRTQRRPEVAARSFVALAFALLGTACGDDDGDRLTASEFEAQANSICAEANDEVDAAAAELFGDLDPNETSSPAEVEAFVDDIIVPNLRRQLDEIDALDPPEDLANEVEDLIAVAESTIDEIDDMSGDEFLGLFQTGEDPFAEMNAKANAIGLLQCGDGVTEEE